MFRGTVTDLSDQVGDPGGYFGTIDHCLSKVEGSKSGLGSVQSRQGEGKLTWGFGGGGGRGGFERNVTSLVVDWPGTDRGHQVPLASFTGTPHWETTNYLSNVTPQRSALNRGAWALLERAVRDLAWSTGAAGVYVATGPLYERPMPPLPGADEPHVVPSGYWKVVSVAREGGAWAAGFVFDQDTPREARHCDQRHQTTVREIERRTGLDFFHGLAQARQDIIETAPPTLLSELGCGAGAGP